MRLPWPGERESVLRGRHGTVELCQEHNSCRRHGRTAFEPSGSRFVRCGGITARRELSALGIWLEISNAGLRSAEIRSLIPQMRLWWEEEEGLRLRTESRDGRVAIAICVCLCRLSEGLQVRRAQFKSSSYILSATALEAWKKQNPWKPCQSY